MFSLSDKPTELPQGETAYGLVPAIPFRHIPPTQGHLVQVDKDGKIVKEWQVLNNADAIAYLKGRKVTLPPGYPILTKDLQEAGVTVRVWPNGGDSYDLACSAFAGVEWI